MFRDRRIGGVILRKYRKYAGADNKTPSIPQYFSWINSTNEGSTEQQTITNLEFFDYLRRTYGMQIKIYAWDAGNFDGASNGYGDTESEKFLSQYPNGYAPVVRKAAESGIRLGLWGSPDGFGDTPEEQKKRFDFMVHLCRDYNFAEFKIDGVCGHLRPDKAGVYADMLTECRRYSPDLVVLNHRLNLYEAEKHVTTFLWNGRETYVDVLSCNENTAMHHRAFMFTRGNVDGLARLAEDHGVCISSYLDYFEDELIYQAFGRSLILAPEIYGNPWLLKDSELSKLARIYNLHGRNADILVEGKLLPASYGCNAVSRGSEEKRFITTGNNSWETGKITVSLTEEIGIAPGKEYDVNIHHPYEKHLGTFSYGEKIEIELMPFRATLIEVSVPGKAEKMLRGCEYEIIREDSNGKPVEVRKFRKGEREQAPVFLGTLTSREDNPSCGELLYETAMYSISNDALEARELKRSGETRIPQVKAARDAFFSQQTYRLRGCEASAMFDGRDDTFFDSQSKNYCDQCLRIDGGCLRVDLGKITDADTVEIEFFAVDEPFREIYSQTISSSFSYSRNLKKWQSGSLERIENIKDITIPYVRFTVHTVGEAKGRMVKAVYPVKNSFRYFRLESPPDRIYHFRVLKDGKEIKVKNAFANNMQANYHFKTVRCDKSGEFILPRFREGSKLAVAVEGSYPDESVYCTARIDGKYYGFPDRAPGYKANQWEHRVCSAGSNHTFFLPLDSSWQGKKINVHTIFCSGRNDAVCNVYLCDSHT